MSDYQKNLEYFERFRAESDSYFERYVYVCFKNKSDFLLWFMLESGDFLFGRSKALGELSFFFDNQNERDRVLFAQLRGGIVEICDLRVQDLSEAELKQLKRRIKRLLKETTILPEGVLPREAVQSLIRAREDRD